MTRKKQSNPTFIKATKEKNSCFRKDVVNGDKGRKVNCHLEYEDVFKKSNRFCHQRIGVSQSTYDSNFDPIDEEKFTSCGYRLRSSRGKDLLTVDIESTYNGSKAERMIDNSSDCNSYSSSPDHSNSVITRVGSQLQLPRGVLYLKEVVKSDKDSQNPNWTVYSAVPLLNGSSFGPFSGRVVESRSDMDKDFIIEFCNMTDHVMLLNVKEESGAWLTLLRQVAGQQLPNILVYLEGGYIWCDVISDVESHTELCARFVYNSEKLLSTASNGKKSSSPTPSRLAISHESITSATSEFQNMFDSRISFASSLDNRRIAYNCPFCGVKFSSHKTLYGHLAHYCSKKNNGSAKDNPIKIQRERHIKTEQGTCAKCVEPLVEKSSQTKQYTDPVDEMKREAIETTSGAGQQDVAVTNKKKRTEDRTTVNCTSPVLSVRPPTSSPQAVVHHHHRWWCTFSTNQQSDVKRHFSKVHHRKKTAKLSRNATANLTQSRATFCRSCNIQFSSINTYRCHREHYCSKRHALSGDSSPVVSDTASKSTSLTTDNIRKPLNAQPINARSSNMTNTVPIGLCHGSRQADILMAPMITGTTLLDKATSQPPFFTHIMKQGPDKDTLQECREFEPENSSAPLTQLTPTSPVTETTVESDRERQTDFEDLIRPVDRELASDDMPLDLSAKSNVVNGDHLRGNVDKQCRKRTETPSHLTPATNEKRLNENTEHTTRQYACTPNTSNNTILIPPIELDTIRPHFFQNSIPFIPTLTANRLTPSHPMVHHMVATAVSNKCADCNIIFYKHENFLIHKQYYCSGEKMRNAKFDYRATGNTKSTPKNASPVTPDIAPACEKEDIVNESITDDSGVSIGDANGTTPSINSMQLKTCLDNEDLNYKFYCIPCKIKYSSSKNLRAHKEFYCPHGKDSDHAVIVQTPAGKIVHTANINQPSEDTESSAGVYTCKHCHSDFESARLLRHHLCVDNTTSSAKCCHCEYVTHTAKRLAEHTKVHNPTCAYKCLLCGYRGNTMRGMKMHGKAHMAHSENFLEHHVVELEEPPLDPVNKNSDKVQSGMFNTESELLRLKNEPYKRRRSRKSFELQDTLLPHDAQPAINKSNKNNNEVGRQHPEKNSLETEKYKFCDTEHVFLAKSTQNNFSKIEVHQASDQKEEKENQPHINHIINVPANNGTEKTSTNNLCPVTVNGNASDNRSKQTIKFSDLYQINRLNTKRHEQKYSIKHSEKAVKDILGLTIFNGTRIDERNTFFNNKIHSDSMNEPAERNPEKNNMYNEKIQLASTEEDASPKLKQKQKSQTQCSSCHPLTRSINSPSSIKTESPETPEPILPKVLLKQNQSKDRTHTQSYINHDQAETNNSSQSASILNVKQEEKNHLNSSHNNHCDTCNIFFTYRKTYLAHKKYYCKTNN